MPATVLSWDPATIPTSDGTDVYNGAGEWKGFTQEDGENGYRAHVVIGFDNDNNPITKKLRRYPTDGDAQTALYKYCARNGI
jgi:hypothetical protein